MSVLRQLCLSSVVASVILIAGCEPQKSSTEPIKIAPSQQPAAKPVAAAPTTIRVKAGAAAPMKDKAGHIWQADTGFADGEVVDRGAIQVAGTTDPSLFQTEHYGMTRFAQTLPNGKYTVKLYFAETYDGITTAGERVFSVNVEGKELKDIDVFKEAGGLNKALVKTVDVEVKDSKLDITFTPTAQSAEINAIEIIPKP